MPQSAAANRAANIWTARIIPVILLAIIAYASYVVTKVECIDYLLNPSPSLDLPVRSSPAIAILVIYYILLFILAGCYARLVATILLKPGLVPRGPQWYVENERKKAGSASEKEDPGDENSSEGFSAKGTLAGADAFRVQDFWLKDVFICQWDGRPKFCSTCYNYKLDRVHHCSELNRCVYKMDHFCPWVGGIVGESSFKYFIQFVGWTGVFCLFNIIHIAYFFAERQRHVSGLNVHWLLGLAFSALFFLFGTGMCGSSLQFAFENTTTIENLDRRTHVYYIAVYVPPATFFRMTDAHKQTLRWIEYPRPPAEQLHLLQNNASPLSQPFPAPNSPQAPGLEPHQPTPPAPIHNPNTPSHPNPATLPTALLPEDPNRRTFAILQTPPGHNPFDLTPTQNFKEVMGTSFIDWLLPIRPSPCTQHRRSTVSMYRMGRVVYKLKRDAGILEDGDRKIFCGERTQRKRKANSAGSRRRESSKAEARG